MKISARATVLSFFLCCPLFSLELSKDAVIIRNSFDTIVSDTLVVYNNSSDSVYIDSIYVRVLQADYSQMIFDSSMDLLLNERFYPRMDSIGEGLYRAVDFIDYADPPGSRLGIAPGDSLVFSKIEVGNCLVCGRLPSYPVDFRIEITFFPHQGDPVSFTAVDDAASSIGKKRSYANHVSPQGSFHYFDIKGRPASENQLLRNPFSVFIFTSRE